MIEAVSAVIVRKSADGPRLLLQQRPPTKDYALRWECPGGKTEPNDSHHSALRRELLEELGLAVEQIGEASIWCGHVNSEAGSEIFLLMYPVRLFPSAPSLSSDPLPKEGQGLGWFTEGEAGGLVSTPGNVAAWRYIRDYMRWFGRNT